mgnify:CR=1 FL=1
MLLTVLYLFILHFIIQELLFLKIQENEKLNTLYLSLSLSHLPAI